LAGLRNHLVLTFDLSQALWTAEHQANADAVACLIQCSASHLDLRRGLPGATLDATMIFAEAAQISVHERYGERTGSGRETGAIPQRHG
jgi:hypothetical protein